MHLIPTKHGESALWLDGLASVIESEEFLKVCLYDSEASVDGWVAKAVCEEEKLVRPGYGLLRSLALMLLGPPTALSMAWSSEMTSLCVCVCLCRETERGEGEELDWELDLQCIIL